MNTKGIEYKLTGQRERGEVAGYHRKPDPLHLGKGAKRSDVAALKSTEARNVLTFDGMDYSAKFTIGMEVEKNQLHRNAVHEYELFCGFERDGSCGYEAVTHILPLLPASTWRTKVFDIMHKAEKIIDDRYSPSDNRCGGHITIAVEGMTGDEVRAAIRKNCGIVLALFRKRLKNHYCGYNKRMQHHSECQNWHHKYQTALDKGAVLEFRLPSRFQSVKQMMRRYELFYEIVRFSTANANGSHDALLKNIRPIIVSMYEGDAAKADEIIGLSRHFRNYILKGKVDESIAEFLR